jgi:hypothetical protein
MWKTRVRSDASDVVLYGVEALIGLRSTCCVSKILEEVGTNAVSDEVSDEHPAKEPLLTLIWSLPTLGVLAVPVGRPSGRA